MSKQLAFNILLRVSEGVESVDDYYGGECAFCGTHNDDHEKDCETVLAIQALKSEYTEMYHQHLSAIEQKKAEQQQREQQRRQKEIDDHNRKHTKCTLCDMEVRRVDLAAHINSKRCIKQQKRNSDNYGQMITKWSIDHN